jgi:uncharacterized protein YbjT (DUF2867 family)
VKESESIILVTGGTGHLGRDLVARLVAQRRTVRVLARTQRNDPTVQWVSGDLATGEGINEALQGVHSVVNAATSSPIAQRGRVKLVDFFKTPSAVDIDGTQRMLEASERAGVQHFLHVSIVGLEDSGLPYSRVKLAGEYLVRQSPLPWSVVRATPYFYLLANMLTDLGRLPVWPLPTAPWNPVDTTDVADYLAECLDDRRRGVRDEIGGPEDLGLVELARQYQQVRAQRRPILRLPLPERLVRNMGLVRSQGRRGKTTWATWLAERTGGAGA